MQQEESKMFFEDLNKGFQAWVNGRATSMVNGASGKEQLDLDALEY